MASCVKSDIDESMGADYVIAFTSSVEATRATQSTVDSLYAYGKFKVAAFLNDDNKTHYYTNDVTYEDGVWLNEITRYWSVLYSLNMFAYSPLEDFIAVNNATDYNSYSLQYSCPADINEQVDLLAVSVSNQTYDTNGVELAFKHILSSIKFKVEFEDETNVTLNTIAINYINIERERSYNFYTGEWGDSESKYFDASSGYSTTLEVYKDKESNSGSIIFGDEGDDDEDDIPNQLMIIPQPVVSSSSNSANYITIQISYMLNGAQDDSTVEVLTGVVSLPAPNEDSYYKMGEIYTYNIVVNNELVTFNEVTISDQLSSEAAYGNIDLGLITRPTSPADIGYTEPDEDENGGVAQLYYTTATRVEELLEDGVRDFVVVGSMGANSDDGSNTLGNGKLGYYGSTSSPFYIGAFLAGFDSEGSDYISVDLRGTYDYPKFKYANNDTTNDDGDGDGDGTMIALEISTEEGDATEGDDLTIGDDEPILIAGLFADILWLDEVIFPNGIAAIGNHAFNGCTALRHIDLADVRHIEIGAFQNCINLEVVDNGVLTRVHENGFDDCESLTTIDLSNVVEIDDYGFVNCENLTDVNLQNLDDIGAHAFSGCLNLTLKTDTTIPGFTAVAEYAFSKCAKLGENGTTIDLTETTTVGRHAFDDCEHLQISSGDLAELTDVGQYAFSECFVLGKGQEFVIPNLVSVGEASFSKCYELNIVEGLENLTEIPNYAFQACTLLTGYSTIATDQQLSLPEVTSVGAYGLTKTAITDVVFSDKLTFIGEYAFDDCSALKSLSNLDQVTSVGRYAFSSCTSLEALELPLLTSENCGVYFFSDCTSLKTISLPLLTQNAVSYLDDEGASHESSSIVSMSNDSESIEYIDLRSLEGSIDKWAFSEKVNLKYADFSAITEVEAGVFYSCTALETAFLSSATSVDSYAFQNCSKLATLKCSSLKTVGEGAFEGCSSLTELDIPLVDTVGQYAFKGCSLLQTLKLPNVTSVGQSAFEGCSLLQTLELPNVMSVGQSAFEGCSSLTELDLPLVDTVGQYAFEGCSLLQTLKLSNVMSVGQSAFEGCSSLTELDLPLVETVGDNAFDGCSSLQTFSLPSATSVGSSLFTGCSSLTELYLPNVGGEFGSWEYFADSDNIKYIDLSSVENLVGGTFVNCENLEAIDLGGVTTIGQQPFVSCSSLVRLNLSGLVDSANIDEGVFWNFDTTEDCEIWLSTEQYGEATITDEYSKWQGKTWKAIHTDTSTFNLILTE